MTADEACRVACLLAGQGDAEWNKRFVDALGEFGFSIHIDPADDIMAPLPFDGGWKYPYPSYIRAERLDAVIESVRIIPLRPHDVLLFKAHGMVSEDTAARIKNAIQEFVPDIKVIVLGDDANIEVLRKVL